MYDVVMLRNHKNIRSGFYIKEFGTLEELSKYIMSPNNLERCYRIRGLTRKEQLILNTKCWSVFQRKDA